MRGSSTARSCMTSTGRSPKAVVEMMNRYFSEMAVVIRDNGGGGLQFVAILLIMGFVLLSR